MAERNAFSRNAGTPRLSILHGDEIYQDLLNHSSSPSFKARSVDPFVVLSPTQPWYLCVGTGSRNSVRGPFHYVDSIWKKRTPSALYNHDVSM